MSTNGDQALMLIRQMQDRGVKLEGFVRLVARMELGEGDEALDLLIAEARRLVE